MHVTDKGQVTIPKHDDRRAKLRAAAARVRSSLSSDFKQLGADEIMAFLRGDEVAPAAARRGRR